MIKYLLVIRITEIESQTKGFTVIIKTMEIYTSFGI